MRIGLVFVPLFLLVTIAGCLATNEETEDTPVLSAVPTEASASYRSDWKLNGNFLIVDLDWRAQDDAVGVLTSTVREPHDQAGSWAETTFALADGGIDSVRRFQTDSCASTAMAAICFETPGQLFPQGPHRFIPLPYPAGLDEPADLASWIPAGLPWVLDARLSQHGEVVVEHESHRTRLAATCIQSCHRSTDIQVDIQVGSDFFPQKWSLSRKGAPHIQFERIEVQEDDLIEVAPLPPGVLSWPAERPLPAHWVPEAGPGWVPEWSPQTWLESLKESLAWQVNPEVHDEILTSVAIDAQDGMSGREFTGFIDFTSSGEGRDHRFRFSMMPGDIILWQFAAEGSLSKSDRHELQETLYGIEAAQTQAFASHDYPDVSQLEDLVFRRSSTIGALDRLTLDFGTSDGQTTRYSLVEGLQLSRST